MPGVRSEQEALLWALCVSGVLAVTFLHRKCSSCLLGCRAQGQRPQGRSAESAVLRSSDLSSWAPCPQRVCGRLLEQRPRRGALEAGQGVSGVQCATVSGEEW